MWIIDIQTTTQYNGNPTRLKYESRYKEMAKKLDSNADLINEFIRFCYEELKEAALTDRLNQQFEYLNRVLSEKTTGMAPIGQDPWEVYLKYQKECHTFLEWFYDNRYTDIFLVYNLPNAFMMAGREKAKSFFLSSYDGSPERADLFQNTFDMERLGQEIPITIFNRNDDTKPWRKAFPRSSVAFLNAIANYPVESLIRCPECKKIFFNPTKRKKKFCTLRCQNLAAVHRMRQKNQS